MKLPIYLDYMASTPVHPQVAEKMAMAMTIEGVFANPSSDNHLYGLDAQQAVAKARQQVADLISAEAKQIVWTGSATESNNLAIKGVAEFYQHKGKHIITCSTEHKAVLNVCQYLQTQGYDITWLKPDKKGHYSLDSICSALRDDTILVSVMHVNSEIGTIQDIAKIGVLTRQHNILFHVDAAQSAGKLPIDVKAMNIDLLSLSAHKFYGPKGVGALYIGSKPRVRLTPQIHGAGQENGLRAGTLALHQIVGMGAACDLVQQHMETEVPRLQALRDRFWQGLQTIDDVVLNGDLEQRVCNNLNVAFAGVEGEALITGLTDIAVSRGAACNATTVDVSHVLSAIGLPQELAASSLRFSVGYYTTEEEIDYAIEHISQEVQRLRYIACQDSSVYRYESEDERRSS